LEYLLYEITSGRSIDYVWAEGKLLAKVETTGTTYFHHDHLGSSKLQTDGSGNVVSSDVTQPFGPRICADAIKDEFTTLDGVNTVASTVVFDTTNGVVKAPHGANGYQTGELYTIEFKPGVAVRVVKLGWTGSGVTFYVSTDGNTWSQLQKDQPLSLGTSARSLYLKAILTADASSFLDRYLLQINPTGFNLFTGKMLTEETGLVYFGARWYDPEIGRWITVDPAEDGENWYGYCGNNPVNYTDLEGRFITPANWVGAGVGVASGLVGYSIAVMIDPRMRWNTADAMIAASFGGVIGFVAPWMALVPGGAGVIVTLGANATMNVAQYVSTEVVHGRKPTKQGIAWATITGLIAGKFVPRDTTLLNMSWNPKFFIVNTKDAFKSIDEIYQLTYRNELAKRAWRSVFTSGTLRSMGVSIISNLNDFSKEFVRFIKDLLKEYNIQVKASLI
jgi:RHS repeat-associated protein